MSFTPRFDIRHLESGKQSGRIMIDDERLVDLVRANDAIYNKRSLSYRFPEKKKAAWAGVAQELGATEDQCTRRWQSLRERYSRELKRLDAPSGSAAALTETWPLFESMGFLKEFVKPRATRCTTNILSEFPTSPPSPTLSSSFSLTETLMFTGSPDAVEATFSTEELAREQPTPTTSQKKRKRQESDADGEFREACQLYKDMCKERVAQKGSQTIRAFGQMIGSTVSEMSEAKQVKAIQVVTNTIVTIKLEPEE
ncbi:transcription factor Adf-1-like [Rhagoletis pomonella]|uniref:transcription factor Adf-1-like n=1 Tax=Rhagoletis pomonella TaxID=28610 RepID=UPI001784F577|nr:transcription factor Adf-1-like [Rhagoletis pomonella]